ncbi:MAG TPA: lysophospholipid acyltransferase family protein [Verrucomicrobiales bacterium]|nr:lysophospholipid acyltransferase family protein [Verrucomicrobiae bacterium]MCP5552811.1 lysophospholipid acyltransferase family protein [Akkermansiaceae bacterium]HRX54595.1 lysophospholipid acyltransferase family protein [Verrucomicrobiales bacterium]
MGTLSVWKKLRHSVEASLLRLAVFLIPRLSRRALMALARTLGTLAWMFDFRGRATAMENLRVVFGDTLTSSGRRRIARKSYEHFARTMLDQFWSRRLTADNFLDYCTLELEDEASLEAARESGAIWVTPHYSNFEWIAFIMGFRGYHFTVVAQDFKNPQITPIFTANRQGSGHQVIPQQGAMLRLLKNLKVGGHAAFLTDLNVKPSKTAAVIRCFGRKTCVTTLHSQLMRRTRLPVIPGLCIPKADGTYRMLGFHPIQLPPEATDAEIAQACWDVFEAKLREEPAPWLWMYKHWRYLPEEGDPAHGPATVTYPSYAQASKAFRKLDASQTKAED